MPHDNAHGVDQIAIRGTGFAAWITTVVLAAVIATAAVNILAAAAVLAVQAAVFAIGAVRGPRSHPYGRIYARLVAPRIGPVTEHEPVPPLQFAQLVGLVFALIGLAGFIAGLPLVGVIATALALFDALLNAAFGICLGCTLYSLATRLRYARDRA